MTLRRDNGARSAEAQTTCSLSSMLLTEERDWRSGRAGQWFAMATMGWRLQSWLDVVRRYCTASKQCVMHCGVAAVKRMSSELK